MGGITAEQYIILCNIYTKASRNMPLKALGIAIDIGGSRNNEAYRKVEKLLLSNNIAVKKPTSSKNVLIIIDFNKLFEFICNTEIFISSVKFIRKYDPLGVGVIYGK